MNEVQTGGKLSDSLEDTSIARQGDSLSTLQFNLTLEKIIHKTTLYPRGIVFNRTKQYMAYADDVNTARSIQAINKVIQEMEELSNDTDLQVHVDRTKYMNTSKYKYKNMQPKTTNINYKGHPEGSEFKYLGSQDYV